MIYDSLDEEDSFKRHLKYLASLSNRDKYYARKEIDETEKAMADEHAFVNEAIYGQKI